jgi:hypothetical protein
MPGRKQGGVRCAQGRLCAVPHNNSAKNGKLEIPDQSVRQGFVLRHTKGGCSPLCFGGLGGVGLARIPPSRTYLACWNRALIVVIIPTPFAHVRVFLIDTQVHNRLGSYFSCSTHPSYQAHRCGPQQGWPSWPQRLLRPPIAEGVGLDLAAAGTCAAQETPRSR